MTEAEHLSEWYEKFKHAFGVSPRLTGLGMLVDMAERNDEVRQALLLLSGFGERAGVAQWKSAALPVQRPGVRIPPPAPIVMRKQRNLF